MDAAVVDSVFEQSLSVTSRIAAVRAATIATVYGLPSDSRRDLEQEALLELWRKRPAYDARRGSWRAFSERVVANRLRSIVRSMHTEPSGHFREEPLETFVAMAAPSAHTDLRTDVSRVLANVSQFDRSVAVDLIDYSASEIGQRLGASRATVYRAIGRLRAAFAEAGLSPWRNEYECDMDRAVTGE
jgi:DNA-directed RNA polymerase specialized sigma24 family protein